LPDVAGPNSKAEDLANNYRSAAESDVEFSRASARPEPCGWKDVVEPDQLSGPDACC